MLLIVNRQLDQRRSRFLRLGRRKPALGLQELFGFGFRFDFEQTHEATEVVFVVITASDRFVPSPDVLIGEQCAVECSHEPSRQG